jgi:exodeoxyribonuclease VII large subunit
MRLGHVKARLTDRHPARRLLELENRIRALARSMRLQARRVIGDRQRRLANLARTLHAVSPLETVGRGYAVLLDAAGQRVISHTAGVVVGEQIAAQLADGRLHCTVNSIGEEQLGPERPESSEPET